MKPQAPPARRRIAPTPIQVQVNEKPDHMLLVSETQPAEKGTPIPPLSALASSGGQLPASRRMLANLTEHGIIDYKQLLKQHGGLLKKPKRAAPPPDHAADAPLVGQAAIAPLQEKGIPRPGGGGGNVFTDVIKRLESRYAAGGGSGSEGSEDSEEEEEEGGEDGESEGGSGSEGGEEDQASEEGDQSGSDGGSDGGSLEGEADGGAGTTDAEAGEAGGGAAGPSRPHRPHRERQEAYEEDFIDDSDIIRARRGAVRSKFGGFFVNRGRVDTVEDETAMREQEVRKRKPTAPRPPRAPPAPAAAPAPAPEPVQGRGDVAGAGAGQPVKTTAGGTGKRKADKDADKSGDTPTKKKTKVAPATAAAQADPQPSQPPADPAAPAQPPAASKPPKQLTLAQKAAQAGQAVRKGGQVPLQGLTPTKAVAPIHSPAPVQSPVLGGSHAQGSGPTAAGTTHAASPQAATLAQPDPAAAPALAPTPIRKGSGRAPKGVDSLLDTVRSKLRAIAGAGEGDGEEGGRDVKRSSVRSGMKLQLVSLAIAVFREHGEAGHEEALVRVAQEIANTPGALTMWPQGEEAVGGELRRMLADARKQLSDLKEEVQEQVAKYAHSRGVSGGGGDVDLDPVAIACLEKLVASARKLVGVDKEGDLLREVAGWDSSKTLTPAALVGMLEGERARRKKGTPAGMAGEETGQAGTAPAEADEAAAPQPPVKAKRRAKEPKEGAKEGREVREEGKDEKEAGDGPEPMGGNADKAEGKEGKEGKEKKESKKKRQTKEDKGSRESIDAMQVDPTQAATQADVVTASQNNAGGSAEAAGVNVEGGAAGGEGAGPSSQPSQPAAKLTPQQEQEQWEAAKAAAQTGGATNMNQLQHWYDMKLPTNSKAVLKALCYAGKEGFTTRQILDCILEHNMVPGWDTKGTVSNVRTALTHSKLKGAAVHVGGHKYALVAFPDVHEEVKTEKEKKRRGAGGSGKEATKA